MSATQPPSLRTLEAEISAAGPNPGPDAIAYVWHCALETFESVVEGGKTPKRARRSLVRFLAQYALFHASGEPALLRMFKRKLAHWRLNGKTASCLVDRRIEANKKRIKVLPEVDFTTVCEVAARSHFGDVVAGLRHCKENNLLTRPTDAEYQIDWSRKSDVPRAWMRDLKPAVTELTKWFHSPRNAKLNGADVLQAHDEYYAGDFFTADDKTLDVLYAHPAKTKSGWKVMQGQFLVMGDEKAKFVLAWLLTFTEQYTGVDVKKLTSTACREHGLPNCGWVTECGLWKNSRLVGGKVLIGEHLYNFADRLGLIIKRASPGNSKGKLIENILGLIDRHLRGELCWAGHDQKKLKIEQAQRARLDVESGRKTPAEAGMMTYDQWCQRLRQIVEKYNNEPQNSKVMGCVMSPAQAWLELRRRNAKGELIGQTPLPANSQWLLDSHLESFRYTNNGVKIPASYFGGKKDAYYASAETSRFINHKVDISFSPEFPEFATLLSQDRRQVWILARRWEYQRHSNDRDSFQKAAESRNELNSYFRGWAQAMRSKFGKPAAQPIMTDSKTEAIGAVMRQAEAVVVNRRRATNRQTVRKNTLARAAGLDPAAIADPRYLELLTQGLNDES